MPRFQSIRARLIILSLVFVASLVVTNLILIHQVRLQNDLIEQQRLEEAGQELERLAYLKPEIYVRMKGKLDV